MESWRRPPPAKADTTDSRFVATNSGTAEINSAFVVTGGTLLDPSAGYTHGLVATVNGGRGVSAESTSGPEYPTVQALSAATGMAVYGASQGGHGVHGAGAGGAGLESGDSPTGRGPASWVRVMWGPASGLRLQL